MKRIAVAVHGCHVGATDWPSIIWGNPSSGIMGRASKAICLARELDADIISFSTGASQINGLKEAELIFSYSIVHHSELDIDVGWLERRCVLDLLSQNTKDEMVKLDVLCEGRGITKLYLVSSPWHVLRCHKEALIHKTNGGFVGVEILAVASDDSSDILKAENVSIIEPPHRGDDLSLSAEFKMHEIIPLLFRLDPEKRNLVLGQLKNMID